MMRRSKDGTLVHVTHLNAMPFVVHSPFHLLRLCYIVHAKALTETQGQHKQIGGTNRRF
jgi:hypothetical protein